MSIVGILTALLIFLASLMANWPANAKIFAAFSLLSTFLPPLLNYMGKTLLSRISFLFIANGSSLAFPILFGPFLHFQYYLIALLGLPFLFLGKEIGKKKFLLSLLGIILFLYLEWHARFFSSMVSFEVPFIDQIRLMNDVMVAVMIIAQFFFFVRENEKHLLKIEQSAETIRNKNLQLERFAYISSHDLKEPLRTVTNFIGLIKQRYHNEDDQEASTFFKFIDESITRMPGMIAGLLNYSRLGKAVLYEQINLNSLLSDVVQDLNALINEKNVVLTIGDLPVVMGYKIELRQLFQNLITNAIKFQLKDRNPIISIGS